MKFSLTGRIVNKQDYLAILLDNGQEQLNSLRRKKVTNPLNKRLLERHPNCQGLGNRCKGTSTAMALGFISKAIQNPGIQIDIFDHEEGPRMQQFMARLVEDTINKLGLDFMTIRRKADGNFTLTFGE